MISEGKQAQHESPIAEVLHVFEEVSGKDDVLGQIAASIKGGWESIGESERVQLVKLLEDVFRLGRYYSATYQTLERISSPEVQLHFEDQQEGLRAIERADSGRRAAHNAAIDAINILSRYMKQIGMDNQWRGSDRIFSDDPQTMREAIAHWIYSLNKQGILDAMKAVSAH